MADEFPRGDGNDPETVVWRLKQLENRVAEAVTSLGAGISSLQTQIAAYQQGQVDRFISIREFSEFRDKTEHRLEEMARDSNNRGWAIAGAILTAGIALLAVVVNIVKPH